MSDNKYKKYFSSNMSSLRISTIFYSLCDEAKKNGELEELKEAFLPAYQKAEKNEAHERYGL